MADSRIAIVATLDTKAEEAAYLARRLQRAGAEVVLLDAGLSAPGTTIPIDGFTTLGWCPPGRVAELTAVARPERMRPAAEGIGDRLARLRAEGALDAVVGLGGGTGAWLFTEAVRALPFGFPKALVATGVGRDASQDILVLSSVADIAGVNPFFRSVADHACDAVLGILAGRSRATGAGAVGAADEPLVALTMYGVTTRGADHARRELRGHGLGCVAFHANGVGGATMERFAAEGAFVGILDWTTTELANSMFGTGRDGSSRLRADVPRVVVPGALELLTVRTPLPRALQGRAVEMHLPDVALVRLSRDECRAVGAEMAARLSRSSAPVAVVVPTRGWSAHSVAGGSLADPDADAAWLDGLRAELDPRIRVELVDAAINDAAFAATAVGILVGLIEARTTRGKGDAHATG